MKRDEIFRELDPPRGGLAALRSKMNARPRSRWKIAVPVTAVAAVALAVVAFLLVRGPRDSGVLTAARESGGTGEIALGLSREPAAPVVLSNDQAGTSALSEVRTKNPNVLFYWVDSTEWKQ